MDESRHKGQPALDFVIMNAKVNFLPPPAVIFKYFHPDRSGILRDLRIRFANPATFNDPFEVCPRFDLLAEKTAQAAVEQCKILNAQLGIPIPKSTEFLDEYKKRMLPERVKYHSEQFQKECGERFRMLCFCESVESPLMWGHYCDSHKGFALKFDTKHSFFQNRLANVQYSENRPQADDPAGGILIPLTKNNEWRYEHEWRIIQNVNSSKPHFENLPSDCIKAVYFGLRISPSVRRELEFTLQFPSLAHIERFDMYLDPAEYKLKPILAQPYQLNNEWWIGDGI